MVDTEIGVELQTTSHLKAIPFEPDPWLSEALESIVTSIANLMCMVQDIHQSSALTSVEETRLRLERLETFFTDPRTSPGDMLEKLIRQKDLDMQTMHSGCQFVNIGDVDSLDGASTEDLHRMCLSSSDLVVDSTATPDKHGASVFTTETEMIPRRLMAATDVSTADPDTSVSAVQDSTLSHVGTGNVESLHAECVRREDLKCTSLTSSDLVVDSTSTLDKPGISLFAPEAELLHGSPMAATDVCTADPDEFVSATQDSTLSFVDVGNVKSLHENRICREEINSIGLACSDLIVDLAVTPDKPGMLLFSPEAVLPHGSAARDSTVSLVNPMPCSPPVPVATLHEFNNKDLTLNAKKLVASHPGFTYPRVPCSAHHDVARGMRSTVQGAESIAKQDAQVRQPQLINRQLELQVSAEDEQESGSPKPAAATTSSALAGVLSSSAGMLSCSQQQVTKRFHLETKQNAHQRVGCSENSGAELPPRPQEAQRRHTDYKHDETNSNIRCLSQHEDAENLRKATAASKSSAPSAQRDTITVHQAQVSGILDSLARKSVFATSVNDVEIARAALYDWTAQGQAFDSIEANQRALKTEALELSSPSTLDCDDVTDSYSETPTTVLSSSHDQGFMADEVSTSSNVKMNSIRNPFRRWTKKWQAHSPAVPKMPQFRQHPACGGSQVCADEQMPLLSNQPAVAAEVRNGKQLQRPQNVVNAQQNFQHSRFSEPSGMLFGLGLLSQVTYRSEESGKPKALYSMPNRRRR